MISGKNDWYGGISHYLDTCDAYLAKAEPGIRCSPILCGELD